MQATQPPHLLQSRNQHKREATGSYVGTFREKENKDNILRCEMPRRLFYCQRIFCGAFIRGTYMHALSIYSHISAAAYFSNGLKCPPHPLRISIDIGAASWCAVAFIRFGTMNWLRFTFLLVP